MTNNNVPITKKMELAKLLWVSWTKLDNLMKKFGYGYWNYPRDHKVRVVPQEAKLKICEYLGVSVDEINN